jgi:hypothetical protein
MHDDLERLIARQLPRSADDEFLGVLVEILLAERERVEAMKKLGKLFDANLDQTRFCRRRWLAYVSFP